MNCFWLWAENGQIRWWTPDATGLLSSGHPHPNGVEGDWGDLRAGIARTAFRHALQPELVDALETALIREIPLRLKLADDLPGVWQQYPFEWLRFQGSPLSGRLLVERYAPKRSTGLMSFDPGQIAVLNLWPDREAVQPFNDLGRLPRVDVFYGPDVSDDYMIRTDLTRVSLLIIIGHGTERHGEPPLRLGDGSAWGLPLRFGLPRIVLVVACGNERGNLIHYGKTLLDNGAQTVVAPVGRIDAECAAGFLHDFINDWNRGVPVSQILLVQQRRTENADAGWRFCLIGQGEVHSGSPRSPDGWSDRALANAAGECLGRVSNPEALLTLIERITLRCFQVSGGLEDAERRLREFESLAIPYGDSQKEAALLSALDPHIHKLSRLSRDWVLPLLGALCEAHNHLLITKYDRLCGELNRQATPAWAAHYLSKIPYRLGCYARSVASVAKGFEQPGCAGSSQRTIRLLGQLLNLLIDLNLTPNAEIVSHKLNSHLAEYTGADGHRLQIGALDRQARLALRKGDPAAALEWFLTKRRRVAESPDTNDDERQGLRELAWLLYTASWKNPGASEAYQYADEVRRILEDPRAVAANTFDGNADSVYLIRALALWCWRAGNPQSAELLLRYSRFWRGWLDSNRDPGPIGFAVYFMHLYYQDKPVPQDLPRVEKAEVNLLTHNYLLELAALSLLFGERDKTREYLHRFQISRENTLKHLDRLPPWLGLENSRVLAETQTRRETSVLLNESTVTAEQLAVAGLLPL